MVNGSENVSLPEDLLQYLQGGLVLQGVIVPINPSNLKIGFASSSLTFEATSKS